MKNLCMFSNVWGDKHLDLMDKTLIRSLNYPQNKAALKEATWFIYTKTNEFEKARAIANKVDVKEIILKPLPDWLQGTPPQMGVVLLDALIEMITYCLETNSQMLMAPPDTIFSESSIPNMIQMGKYGNSCIAVPHARITPDALNEVGDLVQSGSDLVSLLERFPHKSWSLSEIGVPGQASFIGGIAWERLAPRLTAVQHRLPTIYLANFIQNDIEFFRTSHDGTEPVYGGWDHLWPMKLVREERQRMPGSSDVAFMLEITDAHQNVPANGDYGKREPDEFWRNALHNQHNRQFMYILRGT